MTVHEQGKRVPPVPWQDQGEIRHENRPSPSQGNPDTPADIGGDRLSIFVEDSEPELVNPLIARRPDDAHHEGSAEVERHVARDLNAVDAPAHYAERAVGVDPGGVGDEDGCLPVSRIRNPIPSRIYRRIPLASTPVSPGPTTGSTLRLSKPALPARPSSTASPHTRQSAGRAISMMTRCAAGLFGARRGSSKRILTSAGPAGVGTGPHSPRLTVDNRAAADKNASQRPSMPTGRQALVEDIREVLL